MKLKEEKNCCQGHSLDFCDLKVILVAKYLLVPGTG